MSSREKFEQAIKARFGDLIDYRVCKNSDGEYMAWDMQVAWWAWQASEASTAVQLANTESKCRELAAELSAVDKIHNEAVFITDDHYEQCPPEVQKMIRSLAVLQIPAYDAFLAEVRASGVEMFAGEIGDYAKGKSPATAEIIKATGRNALRFAAQLRKGAAL
ncbi:hypothetical protein ACYCNP_25685 [Citrobacter braakii]|uniref:hypothetical protein n=1 Tax=Citrobacter freundii complex TaxID=1344959 RepID=UPI0022E84D64|nr:MULTISPECIES: hypothetical protein [Citrobacter freundii complex]MDV0582403.1 hypothetical protein [Citrobacter braakii]MEB0654107.1 hypothetical protein [Citrobacter braakii]